MKDKQPAEQIIVLYEKRKTIQNRAVKGKFNNFRNIFFIIAAAIYYIIPWLSWEGRQAILLDVSKREFHFFHVTFLPQDVIYLSLLLIIGAYVLFLFTAIAGRLFCGYACPQTVFANIFMWFDRLIEGDHVKRKRLDESSWNSKKIRIRSLKYLVWIIFALFTGFTFIAYFNPIDSVIAGIKNFSLSGWQTFFLFFSSFMSLFLAGLMREQVCKYMCPYARFQSVMFDKDTMIVSYDPVIGEPRGKRKKDADVKAEKLGYCTDCGVCVDVCPTGIDIRNGLQYECIGCGACIDGCNEIMEKMNYPRGLIRYTSDNGIANRFSKKEMQKRIVRPRILIYCAILIVLFIALLTLLINRNPVKTTIIQDRAAVSRVLDRDKMIEGVYQLRITNSENNQQSLDLKVSGIEGIVLENIKIPLIVPAESTETFIFNVRVPMASVEYNTGKKPGDVIYKIFFDIKSLENESIQKQEKSTFIVRYK